MRYTITHTLHHGSTHERTTYRAETLSLALQMALTASTYRYPNAPFSQMLDDLAISHETFHGWSTFTLDVEPQMLTLPDALDVVARSSFDDGEIVVSPVIISGETPGDTTPLGYVVETGQSGMLSADEVTWTYADGIASGGEREVSRLFDPAEFWDEARHVARNLDHAVEALREGTVVHFAYAVVRDDSLEFDEDSQTYRDADGDEVDELAGWCVLATWQD